MTLVRLSSSDRVRRSGDAHKRDTGSEPSATAADRVLELQRKAGNRATIRQLARQPPTKDKPKLSSPADVAAAADPLDYDAHPGWWWRSVGSVIDGPADEKRTREILERTGVVAAKVLKESTATRVKPADSFPYFSFRHPTRGVVVRTTSGHALGVSKTTDPGGKVKLPWHLFIYTNRAGGEALIEGEPADNEKDDALRRLKGMPKEIEEALGGKARCDKFKKVDPVQLLRIAELLSALTPDELRMFYEIAKLTDDLDAIERSLESFTNLRDRQAMEAKAAAAKGKGKPTLEQQLEETWKGVDAKTWSGMSRGQREAKARAVAAEQAKRQLKHMVTHPGETAKNMAKGLVRVDELGKGIYEDLKEAASGDKNAFRRWAGGMGATAKLSGWLAAVAGIAFLVMFFIPGVNAMAMATAALALGATAIVASSVEAELRIQAAAEASTFEEAKEQTGKSGAAMANVLAGVATMIVAGGLKLIARTPIPGRLKTVGGALDAAKTALKGKLTAGFEATRTALLTKLRGARTGMPESLQGAIKTFTQDAAKIEAMSGAELLDKLAKGDPALHELTGITAADAKSIQELARTPAGRDAPELLRAGVLEELRSAPVDATQRVQKITAELDRTIKAVEGAKTPDELALAIDDAQPRLAPEAIAADADAAVARWAADPDLGERFFKGSKGKPKPPVDKPRDPNARVPVTDTSKQKPSGEPVEAKRPPRPADEPDAAKGSGKQQPPADKPPGQAPPQQPAATSVLEQLDQQVETLRGKRPALEKDVAKLRGDEERLTAEVARKKRQVDAQGNATKRKQLEDELERLEEKLSDVEGERFTIEKAIERLDEDVKRAQEALRAEVARLEKAVAETVPRLEWPEPFTKDKRRPLLGRSGATLDSAVTVSKVPLRTPEFRARLREILKKADSDPQAAGNEFARLIGEHEGWTNLSERFGKEHGQIGRRWDFGNTKEVTIEGRTGGFGAKKLDQFWFDLNEYGSIDLTVPNLSARARADLARLAGEWERWTKRRPTILVRTVSE